MIFSLMIHVTRICDSCDFFNVNFENANTPYLFPEKFKNFLDNSSPYSYDSTLHLNIKKL